MATSTTTITMNRGKQRSTNSIDIHASSSSSTGARRAPTAPSATAKSRKPSPTSSTSNARKRRSPDAQVASSSAKRVKSTKLKDTEGDWRGGDSERSRSPEPVFRGTKKRSALSSSTNPTKRQKAWIGAAFDPENRRIESYDAVWPHLRTYIEYFRNPEDPDDYWFKPSPDESPIVELEFPNNLATEEFILLQPKDEDHYNPIYDLEASVYAIVEHYVPKEHRHLFGNVPRDDRNLCDSDDDTPLRQAPPKTGSTPIHLLRRAIKERNGPLFIVAVDEFNQRMRMLKYRPLDPDPFTPPEPNYLIAHAKTWDDIPKKLLMQILEENYQRCVGPHVPKLKVYTAFSSNVYGEICPPFLYRILQEAGINENSLFMDLGSGVGNLVVQAALQTGCRSYGIEQSDEPAKIAENMVPEFKQRCAMWGIQPGEIEVEHGDMLTSKRVNELMPQADLVLVDNKMFDQALNESLRPKFLDLKEGAIVVSLSPFAPPKNQRMNERNLDVMWSILAVEEKSYRSGDVSWGSGEGSYYVHTVDREGYCEAREKFQAQRGQSRRTRSS